jgi:hypothetical protein
VEVNHGLECVERMRGLGGRSPLLLPPVVDLVSEYLLVGDIDVPLSAAHSIHVIIKSIEVEYTHTTRDRYMSLLLYMYTRRLTQILR